MNLCYGVFPERNRVERRPGIASLNEKEAPRMTSTPRCQIGFDVGGTGLKAALVQSGQIITQVAADTPAQAPPDDAIAVMLGLIRELQQRAEAQKLTIEGVGLGIAGLIDAPAGVVVTSPNLPTWQNVPLAERLQQATGLPVAIDNDVRAMAMGEMRYGAGIGAQHLVCLTVGTGVGSALIFNGEIYRGASLSAGEFGHMVVVPQGGRTCGCGNRGCLETVAGTEAILSLARRQLERNLAPQLAAALADQPLSPKLIAEAAAAGDPGAQSVWQEVGHWLGLGLASLVNLLNPQKIVIGGGIAQAGDLLLNPIARAIRQQAFARPAETADLVLAALGPQAGMIGAAAFVEERGQHS